MFKFVPRRIKERKINAPLSKYRIEEKERFSKMSEKLGFTVETYHVACEMRSLYHTGFSDETYKYTLKIIGKYDIVDTYEIEFINGLITNVTCYCTALNEFWK